MKAIKIAVGGPKKSGKTVFLGGLCENLPRDQRYLFRACPDGEGTWTYKGHGSEEYRRKGTFSKEVVDWYCQSLANCEMAPIILVDIGGIPSEENHRILKEGGVTHIILLVGDDPETGESWKSRIIPWVKFASELGLTVLAEVYSDYHGAKDSISGDGGLNHLKHLCASVHYLERGEDAGSRLAIQAVAEKVLNLIETPKENIMDFMNGNTLEIAGLASTLGKEEVERTLPNGKTVKQLVWEGSDLPKIAELLHNHSAEMPEVVQINGAAPAWLVSALAHECHPRAVSLNSPDGYIGVGCRRPCGYGEGIEFTVKDREDGWTVVEFALNPSKPLAPSNLDEIAPPVLPMGGKVILSGRGPNWLVASLVMAYHGTTKAVACFQPGTGSTVCLTHSAEVELGATISGNV